MRLVWWDLFGRVARPRLPALLTPACAEILLSCLRALRLASEFPCGNSPLVTRCYSLPQNKKPGVERRVQPPTLEWLHAMLDFFLACARKEPHLGSLLTFESDCDAPVGHAVLQTLGPFVTIPAFLFSSSPRNNYFARFPQPCGCCAKRLRPSLRLHSTTDSANPLRPATHFSSPTPALCAAARKALSRVASGTPSRRAKSR
jgi:hypothetical protein